MKNLETLLKDNIKVDCDWSYEPNDNIIDAYGSSNWTAPTEAEYNVFAALIDAYKEDNELFTLTASYDVSGFNYWVIQQEETNYVSINVQLKKTEYTIAEIKDISDAIGIADNYFLDVLTQGEIKY